MSDQQSSRHMKMQNQADAARGASGLAQTSITQDDAHQATGTPTDSTGVAGLDEVLGGGMPRGSLVIVVGPPGSGKTMLANQMAFDAARKGRQVLIFTALSEPTGNLIGHLRTFRFYDEMLVGSKIQILSLQQFLPQGLKATSDELIAIARQARASLVVLDGFRGMRGADDDPQSARHFLYDVGTALGALGTTTIITSEAEPRAPELYPEATTADVIVGLHYSVHGVLQRRAIEVVKVRGAALLAGLHGVRLSDAGIAVYPRLEARVALAVEHAVDAEHPFDAHDAHDGKNDHQSHSVQARTAAASPVSAVPASRPVPALDDARVTFQIPALDALLGGGLPRGSSTLIVGNPGVGKTLLALHFTLAGVAAREPVLYLGFRESGRELLHNAGRFSLGDDLGTALEPGGLVTLQRWAPVELNIDYVADHLLDALDRTGARRLVIDSLNEIERTIARGGESERVDDFLAALVEALQMRRITTLLIKEDLVVGRPSATMSSDPIAALVSNVLSLHQVSYQNELHRIISVLKMRFSHYDPMPREFVIDPHGGIRVFEPSEDQEASAALNASPRDIDRFNMTGRRGPRTSTNSGTHPTAPGEPRGAPKDQA